MFRVKRCGNRKLAQWNLGSKVTGVYRHWEGAAWISSLLHVADFMQSAGAQAELFFWLTVEGYRVTAQQQLEAMQGWQKDGKKHPSATKGLLKAAALGVYEQYLSDKVGGSLRSHF